MIKYPTEFQKYIQRAGEVLRSDLYLHDWEMIIIFEDEQVRERVAAQIDTNSDYLQYTITVYPHLCEIWDAYGKSERKQEVFKVVCHEMCHIFTDPLYKIAAKHSNDISSGFITSIREQWTQRLSLFVYDRYTKKEINSF